MSYFGSKIVQICQVIQNIKSLHIPTSNLEVILVTNPERYSTLDKFCSGSGNKKSYIDLIICTNL